MMAALVAATALTTSFSLPSELGSALDTGVYVGTPAGFRIIALSHIADGCAAQVDGTDVAAAGGARACVEGAFAQAMKTKAKGTSLDSGRDGLWLTHLALILGAGDATGPCLDEALHHRVVAGLAKASLADPFGHTSSYASKRERFPADQAATLAALRRYDVHHHADVSTAPLEAYRRSTLKATDTKTALPWSEVHGFGSGKHPRGCALSFSVRYLSEVDQALARQWWLAYKAHYLVDRVMLVGFREWPPGVNRGADVDSGPIVQGVGAAATAFAIAAARAMDDDALAVRLEATAAIIGAAATLDATAKKASTSTLASAIRFQGAMQKAAQPVVTAPAATLPN